MPSSTMRAVDTAFRSDAAYTQFDPNITYLNDPNVKWPKGLNGRYAAGDYINSYAFRGNPDGFPVLSMAGGPGVALNSDYKHYYNPNDFYVLLSDWRGIGSSHPKGPGPTNNTQGLLEDLLRLQDTANLDKVTLQGNSWGTSMAIRYMQTYPDRVNGALLGLPFLASAEDVKWNYGAEGLAQKYPTEYQTFRKQTNATEAYAIVSSYADRLQSHDPVIRKEAIVGWAGWELTRLGEENDVCYETIDANRERYDYNVTRAAIMADYTRQNFFMPSANGALDRDKPIPDVPIVVFANDRDPIQRPDTLQLMRDAMPSAEFLIQTNADWHWAFRSDPTGRRNNDFVKNAYAYGIEKIRRANLYHQQKPGC